jgi:hypothetical protein
MLQIIHLQKLDYKVIKVIRRHMLVHLLLTNYHMEVMLRLITYLLTLNSNFNTKSMILLVVKTIPNVPFVKLVIG